VANDPAVFLVNEVPGNLRGGVVELGIGCLEFLPVLFKGLILLRINKTAGKKEFPKLIEVYSGTNTLAAIVSAMEQSHQAGMVGDIHVENRQSTSQRRGIVRIVQLLTIDDLRLAVQAE